MRMVMLDLMRLMANGIAAEEAFAAEFADEAAQAERMGDSDTAEIMRDLARRHSNRGRLLGGQTVAAFLTRSGRGGIASPSGIPRRSPR